MANIGTRSDASKVILGCPRKGPEVVKNYPFNSAVVNPGIAGCLNSDGKFVAGAANPLIGISRGLSLTHKDRNSVTLKGKEVPLLLTDDGLPYVWEVEITSFADLVDAGDDTIGVAGVVFTAQTGAVELGDPTFRASSSNDSTAASLAAQINAHAVAGALVEAVAESAVVTITAREVGSAGGELAPVYTDNGEATVGATVSEEQEGVDAFAYVVEGQPVFISDSTGLAIAEDDGTTETNWKYASGVIEGASPAVGGASAKCALVNMAG